MDRSIRELEAVAALGWQAVDRQWLGGWLLRAAEGFTGRANSALPLAEPDRPLPEAVDAVQRWYQARGLRPNVAVPYPLAGLGDNPLDRLLEQRGWAIRPGAAIFMAAATCDAANAEPTRHGDGPPILISDRPNAAWLNLYHYRGQPAPPVASRLLTSAPWQALASLRSDGEIVAIGRVAIASGWAGLSAIQVAPAYRGRGLARATIGALVRVAEAEGAEQMYLQVEDTNDGARALYERCGFIARHRYHYRLGPVA